MRRTLILLAFATMACLIPATAGATTINATPATFAAAVSSSADGDTILLASGSYGTWTGTNKAITIKADTGAAPTMHVDFGNGDSNFTLDGLGGMGGNIITSNPQYGNTTVHDITIRNSDFTSTLTIDGPANANILLDHNVHHNIMLPTNCGGTPAMIHLAYGTDQWNSGVTVQNSVFRDGNADGIQTGVGLNIINNEFVRLRERSSSDCAHTDPMQIIGASGTLVRGNWVHDSADGIVAYDGLDHNIWEDNVVSNLDREGYEIYSDNGSIIRHNTGPHDGCGNCGEILLSHKSSDPVSTGTQAYDNLVYRLAIDTGNGPGDAWARNDHNVPSATAQFVGGSSPGTWAGFALAASSPVGIGAASDGLDAGIRTGGVVPPTPQCSDGIDNDGDGLVDYPTDPGCTSAADNDETNAPPAACADGVDNDSDGLVDYPADPGCSSAGDNDEADPPLDSQPVARFTATPEPSAPGQAVTFDGTTSTCADVPCLYHWHDIGSDGTSNFPLGDGQTLTRSFVGAGTKYVELVVTDADGDVARVMHPHVVASVSPADHTPVARFVASPEPSAPGQQVTFNATATTCEDTPCVYHWHDVGSSGTGDWPLGPNGSTMVFTFKGTGTKYVELVVTDADGDVSRVRHNHVVR